MILRVVKTPEFVTFFQKLGQGKNQLIPKVIQDICKSTGLFIRPIGMRSPLLEVRVVTQHDQM